MSLPRPSGETLAAIHARVEEILAGVEANGQTLRAEDVARLASGRAQSLAATCRDPRKLATRAVDLAAWALIAAETAAAEARAS